MRYIYYTANLFFVFGFLVYVSCCSPRKADLVMLDATIYTMDDKMPVVEAVAVAKGKIVKIGSKEEIKDWIDEKTEVVELQGKTVTPGFIESHGHLMNLGYNKNQIELDNLKSYAELVKKIAEAVDKSTPGEWVVGRGWHQSKWDMQPEPMVKGFPTHHAISRVSPNNPVYLKHKSGHAGLANAKAMEIAGVSSTTEFSAEGEIIKDDYGMPTGIFNENAMEMITKYIPKPTKQDKQKALEMAIQECLENGITSFHDAGAGAETIALYKEFLNSGKLKVRLWVMLQGSNENLLEEWLSKGPEIGSGNNFLTIRSIKLLLDGALGSRGAWLLKPYTDRAGHIGNQTMSLEYLEMVAKKGLNNGFQVCVHAIGDRANREVLDKFEEVFKENPEAARDHRFRIEHAQHLSEQDLPRFAQLGVIASMQAIHMASDRPWAIERLGRDRIEEGAYVWQKLLQSGVKIINGTDVPVEPINPVCCFYASVTRKTLAGFPPEGYEPDQRMTRQQALRSYTLDAAYGAFEENFKGSIEVGKVADFTVFSKDIMKVMDDQLLKTQIEYTIIDGKIVYKKEGDS